MPRKVAPVSLLLALLTALPAAAQTLGTPVYMAPYRAFAVSEVGAMLADPGAGFSLEGYYRYGVGRFDVGIRGGLLAVDQVSSNEVSLLAGADVRFRVLDHSEDFPLDGAFTAGIGGSLGDVSRGFLPVGLSLGRRIELEGGTSFVPYAQPVLALAFGDGGSDVLAALGLGVDFKISRSLDVRVSGGVGDIEGIAIGLSWLR
jgi:hypothetical protein